MEFLSKEELYFSWYLEELQKAGYIDNWGEAKTYQLGEKVIIRYEEQLKTKTKEKEQTILNGCEYTPDFQIHWNIKAENIFKHYPLQFGDGIGTFTELIARKKIETPFIIMGLPCLVEIKPNFDQNNMTRLNTINRKWMYQKYGIFVNLVKVPDIFKDTFTPKKFLLTDSGKQNRIIHFNTRTLEEYVKLKIPKIDV